MPVLGLGLLLQSTLGAGCTDTSAAVERTVTLYAPLACTKGAANPFAQFYPTGDYGADAVATKQGAFLQAPLPALAFPAGTRTVVVDASLAGSVAAYRGYRVLPATGDIAIGIYPQGDGCVLSGDTGARADGAFGLTQAGTLLVVGGKGQTAAPRSVAVDFNQATMAALQEGLALGRSRPSITKAALGALVCGGASADADRAIDSCELYSDLPASPSTQSGDFTPTRITLAQARKNHAAVTLNDGSTLLVGGEGDGELLRTLEQVDAVTGRSRTEGLALLQTPRRNPKVVRLASGEVLIAGGIGGDGLPAQGLEWLTPDAQSASKRARALVAQEDSELIALPGGGALVVLASVAASANAGATALAARAFWITADGDLVSVPTPSGTLTSVHLAPSGRGGALLAGAGDDGSGRWFRFNAWSFGFDPLPSAPAAAPGALVAVDPGLTAWVDDTGKVHTFRHQVLSPYDNLPAPLAASSADGFAPDRPPGDSVRYDDALGLRLSALAEVRVEDMLFGNFSAEIRSISSQLPRVVLADDSGHEHIVSADACAQGATSTLVIERRGTVVRVSDGAGPLRACGNALTASHVRIVLRGPDTRSATIRSLRITRL